MKQEKMVSESSKDGRGCLVVSVILAFIVMLFINGFIGCMGGVPAFLAFLVMFYLTRMGADRKWQERNDRKMEKISSGTKTDSQKQTRQKSLTVCRKKELAGLFAGFSMGYLLIWSLLRVLMAISRVTGWGNLNGASAMEFVKELLHTSLLEKSSYLAAGILMFAFILSLFPLTVIRNHRNWTVYALVDAAGFTLVCLGIGFVCSSASDPQNSVRAVCLIDQFLLCREFSLWEEVWALLGLLVLMLAVGIFAFLSAGYSVMAEAHRDADLNRETEGHREGGEELSGKKEKNRLPNGMAVSLGAAAILVIAAVVLRMPGDNTREGYGKVAQFLTKDEKLGPMEYGGRVYVPVDEDPGLYETGVAKGYLAEKNENCDSRFYRLAVANLLYIDDTCETDLVQMKGREEGTYAPVDKIKSVDMTDPVYVLWDEDWEKESAYSHEPTGYTVGNEGLMEGLAMQFGKVTYRPGDFEDYDAYFTIRAYPSMDAVLEGDARAGQWAGCILVKDNQFYYGSYENRITGICLQQLREILGGNR